MTAAGSSCGDEREERRLVLLDACCLINLCATDRVREVLGSLPHRFAVARYVTEEEVLEVGSEESPPAAGAKPGRSALHPLIAEMMREGLLRQLDVVSREEVGELVRFAAELDDGEAHTCALAIVRGALVATDDRKAIRVLRARASEAPGASEPVEPCIRTSELLFGWADEEGVDEVELARMVFAIARRASFIPPREDPERRRWMRLLEMAGRPVGSDPGRRRRRIPPTS